MLKKNPTLTLFMKQNIVTIKSPQNNTMKTLFHSENFQMKYQIDQFSSWKHDISKQYLEKKNHICILNPIPTISQLH